MVDRLAGQRRADVHQVDERLRPCQRARLQPVSAWAGDPGAPPRADPECPQGGRARVVRLLLVYLWAIPANLLWYTHTILMGSLSLLVWPFDRSGNKVR